MPQLSNVRVKNGTDGSLDVAINAMIAASKPHSFLGIDDSGHVGVVRTRGNPHGHLVLRGGAAGPNYDAASVARARESLVRAGVPSRVMIDLSHDNSRKKFEQQPAVLADVCHQLSRMRRACSPPSDAALGVVVFIQPVG